MMNTTLVDFCVSPTGIVRDLRADPDLGHADADWVEMGDEPEPDTPGWVAVLPAYESPSSLAITGVRAVLGPFATAEAARAAGARAQGAGALQARQAFYVTELESA